MAINRNNKIENHHIALIGASGMGKTTGISQLDAIKNAETLIAFDPMGDHDVTHYQNFDQFEQALIEALETRGKIRIGYNPTNNNRAELEKVAQKVWAIADGNMKVVFLMEELSTCLKASGALDGKIGELFSAGRSYNVQLILSAQRTATIPKDITGNCAYTYFFAQTNLVDAESTAKQASRTPHEVLGLQKGEYFLFQSGKPGTVKKRTKKP